MWWLTSAVRVLVPAIELILLDVGRKRDSCLDHTVAQEHLSWAVDLTSEACICCSNGVKQNQNYKPWRPRFVVLDLNFVARPTLDILCSSWPHQHTRYPDASVGRPCLHDQSESWTIPSAAQCGGGQSGWGKWTTGEGASVILCTARFLQLIESPWQWQDCWTSEALMELRVTWQGWKGRTQENRCSSQYFSPFRAESVMMLLALQHRSVLLRLQPFNAYSLTPLVSTAYGQQWWWSSKWCWRSRWEVRSLGQHDLPVSTVLHLPGEWLARSTGCSVLLLAMHPAADWSWILKGIYMPSGRHMSI